MARLVTLSRLLLLGLFVVAACRDDQRPGLTEPGTSPLATAAQSACISENEIRTLINQVFAVLPPNPSAPLAQFNTVKRHRDAGRIAQAQAQAQSLINFILNHYGKARNPSALLTPGAAGRPRPPVAHGKASNPSALLTERVTALINALYCYVGLGETTVLILPSDGETVVSEDGTLALKVDEGGLTQNTVFKATKGLGNLISQLDNFPAIWNLEILSGGLLPGTVITVQICPDPEVFNGISNLASLLTRLRLGHQRAGGFTVLTPPEDLPTDLECGFNGPSPSSIFGMRVPGWLQRLASAVLPEKAHAAPMVFQWGFRGVGGNTSEFSPFGPIDPMLSARGVGGNTSEFAPPALSNGPAPTIQGEVGTTATPDLDKITVKTVTFETPIEGVKVTWTLAPATTVEPEGEATLCAGETGIRFTNALGQADWPCINFGPTVGYSNLKAEFDASAVGGAEVFVNTDGGETNDPGTLNFLVYTFIPEPVSEGVFDFGSGGWSYLTLSQTTAAPAGWETNAFDAFAAGFTLNAPSPFGSRASTSTACPHLLPFATPWPLGSTAPNGGSDILVRKKFSLASASALSIRVSVDNDLVEIWLNGTKLNTVLMVHENCASPGTTEDFVFSAAGVAGTNQLAIRARDRGVLAYLNVKVSQ
jgi:hypothetical protein